MNAPTPPGISDYYAMLELGQRATQDDIQHAHKMLMHKHHPNRNLKGSELSADHFNDVKNSAVLHSVGCLMNSLQTGIAYDVLGNAKAKQKYDLKYPGVHETWTTFYIDMVLWRRQRVVRERECTEQLNKARLPASQEQSREQEQLPREANAKAAQERMKNQESEKGSNHNRTTEERQHTTHKSTKRLQDRPNPGKEGHDTPETLRQKRLAAKQCAAEQREQKVMEEARAPNA